MAYAALVSLSELVAHILHHPNILFYVPLSDERKILDSLHEKLGFLQAFLDDYPRKSGQTFQSLEGKITGAMYEAQDIIEWQISYQIQISYKDRGANKGCCKSLLPFIRTKKKQLNKYYKAVLLESLDRIDLIVKEAEYIRNVEASQISTSRTPALASSSQAGNSKNEMVGYEEDLIGIQERLCGGSTKLKIIPIVGMGGIGKTTLARSVFDDSLIAYHFHTRAWATISQQYRLQGILHGILHSLTLKTEEVLGEIKRSYLPGTSEEDLIECIYRSLKGKRYLIVLDDMWSTEAWNELRMFFPDDNNGSRIIITSRIRHVAEYASSSPIHEMHFLDERESWDLLRNKVFVEESCPPELEEIGKIVARNCGGLPLAIAVIGGILSNVAMTEYHWKYVADNVSSAVANADGNFSKILSLSYSHLPNHLKPCFLYIGGFFLQNNEISVSNLIRLWVAEGFLKPIESKSLEEAAEEYLEDLVQRNLVLMTNKTWTGTFKFCGMHDLLIDLCIQKADEENFLMVAKRGIDLTNSRRLAICYGMEVEVSNPRVLFIRSILQFNVLRELSSLLLCSRLLRVLVMPNAWLPSFPNEMTEMFHLRYLSFVHDNLKYEALVLPSSISKLQNLQTLIIHRLSTIESQSPVLLEIWKLPQLRHIILKGNLLFIPPPPRIDGHIHVLENLQTISKVINFRFTREATAMIPNVKELKLVYISKDWLELHLSNAVHLQKLEKLKLDMLGTGIVKISDAADASKISVPNPVHYALPSSLRKLSLRGCRPPSEDMSVIGSLPNLEVLKLKAFDFVDRCWETKEGEFTRLKFLRINWSNIMNWRTENSHFPRLEHLTLKCCWVLEEIPCEIGDVATLKMIEVDTCSQTAADSALSIQEEQENMGNEELVVRILSDFE